MRARLQQAGAFLAGMVVPNIGAFIAWGFITALFIPAGWVPNPHLARLVDPMILYLLPILIGFSGGRLVCGTRGAWWVRWRPWEWWRAAVFPCLSARW